jgi:hypothetical protein
LRSDGPAVPRSNDKARQQGEQLDGTKSGGWRRAGKDRAIHKDIRRKALWRGANGELSVSDLCNDRRVARRHYRARNLSVHRG